MEWSQPQIQGDLVTPRAGHSGVTIDDRWYIVGGGDNKNGMLNNALHLVLFFLHQCINMMFTKMLITGCSETLVLDMSRLAWSMLSSVKERHPLASEVAIPCLFI